MPISDRQREREREQSSHRRALVTIAAVVLISSACSTIPGLAVRYEYDESIDLSLDGSATVYVNGSIPALAALGGVNLDPDPLARLDRDAIRRQYTAPGIRVRQITSSRRNSRRFVHITLDVEDVRKLSAVAPLSWSQYQFNRSGGEYVFVQSLGGGPARAVPDVHWNGRETVAFQLHVPSRVLFHNALPKDLRRGNIVIWEMPLAERLAARPARFEVRMETESILYRTLLIFVLTFVSAVTTLGAIVWLVVHQGRKTPAVTAGSHGA